MDIFSLAAKIKLDDDGFQRGITKAEKAGKSLGSSLQNTFSKIEKAAKVFLTGAAIKKVANSLLDLANATAEAGDRIDKQSQVLGLSRKAYQEWDYILGQNGASIDSMSSSMKTLNSLILEAQSGSKEAKDSFAKLGLSIHDIENMTPEEQFEAVVRAFQKMPAGAKKSALAVELFGRNGMELLPLLNQSATSIDELRQRAQELGLIMSDEAVDSAVAYGDSLDDLKRTFTAFKYSIGSQLLPIMTNGIQRLTSYAGKLRNAYEEGGFAGVFKTLISDLKANWPSWSDISKWVTERWKGIQEGFTTVAKLVFGEDENGGIDWPSPEEWGAIVEGKLTELWSFIRDASDTLLRLIFGEDGEGNIDWPDAEEWADIVVGIISTLWESVKAAATSILKLVFGEDSEGGIDWPDPEEWSEIVSSIIESLWGFVKSAATSILKLVFGEDENGGIEWPDAAQWAETLKKILEGLWGAVQGGLGALLRIAFGETEDGSIDWPDPHTMWTKTKDGFVKFWNKLKPSLTEFARWTIGEIDLSPLFDPEAFWEKISTTFSEYWSKIVPFIAGGASWPIGMIVWGAAGDMWEAVQNKFTEFWEAFKLILNSNAIWTIGDATFGTAKEMWDRISSGFSIFWDNLADLINAHAVWTVGDATFSAASEMWDRINTGFDIFWGNLADLFQANAIWTIGDATFGAASEMWDRISTDFAVWWIGVAGKIEEAATWFMGGLLLPSAEFIIGQIENWWNNDVKPFLKLYIQSPIIEGLEETGIIDWASDTAHKIIFGNAKGNWNVPYDDFPALLHRNEMVLTASQARRYRDGEGNGGIDMGQLTSAVVGAIREGMSGAQVNSYLSGRNVTDDVNRNTVRMLKARRFAT